MHYVNPLVAIDIKEACEIILDESSESESSCSASYSSESSECEVEVEEPISFTKGKGGRVAEEFDAVEAGISSNLFVYDE